MSDLVGVYIGFAVAYAFFVEASPAALVWPFAAVMYVIRH